MSVRIVGTRQASSSIRDALSRMERSHAPAQVVRRREIPYWQERGWKRDGDAYTGSYQTVHGAFQGYIEQHGASHIDFFLCNPSGEIRSHSHWVCFQHRGNDWYRVHMGRPPRDVSSGILTIERLITEAYES